MHKEIVAYLNLKTGKNFKHGTQKTRRHINGRIKEGFELDDFKTVIDDRCSKWMNSDMSEYLRPETLFGTKMEGYLNNATKAPVVMSEADAMKLALS